MDCPRCGSVDYVKDSTLFSKIQKENKVLQQVGRNDQNLAKSALEETKQQNYT